MNALRIARRDVRAFFLSPVAYAVLTTWLLWTGLSFGLLVEFHAQQPLAVGSDNPLTNFFGGTVFFFLPMLVFVPVLSMRGVAGEAQRGTLEGLMTAPVSELDVVLGKYLAAMAYWVVLWIPTSLYVWITSRYGDVDLGAIAASYLGIFSLGAYYMGLGVLMGTIARSQLGAAVQTFFALGTIFILGIAEYITEGTTREALAYVSAWTHMQTFARGVVDTRFLVFDGTVAAYGVFMAVRILEQRRLGFFDPGQSSASIARLRQVRSNGLAASALVSILAVLLNYLAFRHYERFDWTLDARYTLSERSERVVADLGGPLEIVVLVGEAEPGYTDLRELLQRYQAASEQVRVQYVDPDRNPTELTRVAQRFELSLVPTATGEAAANVAVVVASENGSHWKITREDLFEIDLDSLAGDEGPQVQVGTERAITGAIVQVLEGEAPIVCVTSGHGEWSFEGGERELALARDELARENLAIRHWPIAGAREVPADCAAVFVIGPRRPFAAAEVALLERYLHGEGEGDGGRLLLALDPVDERGGVLLTGFEEMLREAFITLDPTVVVERQPGRLLTPDAMGPAALMPEGEHPSVRPLLTLGGAVVASRSRSVRPAPGSNAVTLLTASADAYGARDLDRLARGELTPGVTDQQAGGALPVAVATEIVRSHEHDHDAQEGGESGPAAGRLLVIGDSDWLQSQLLGEPSFGNLTFFTAAVGWVTHREALIAIPPRAAALQAVVMTRDDVGGVWLRVGALLPGAMFLLGLAMWWGRRE